MHGMPLPLLLLLFVPVAWLLGLLIVSLLSGWSQLAARFPRNAEPVGQVYTSGSWFNLVYMRYWGRYSGAIYFEAAGDALYLSAIWLLRPFHPPLRIPWSEIRIIPTTYVFKGFLLLILGNSEQIPLRISSGLASNLGLYNRMAGRQAV